MFAVAVIASAVSCLLSIAVGLRLLLLWRRTGELPELCIGVAALAMALGALLGTAYVAVSAGGTRPGGEWLIPPRVVFFAVTPIALWIGVHRVFRPEVAWARVLCWVGVAGSLGAMGLRLSQGLAPRTLDLPNLLAAAATLGGFVWAAAESLGYYARMRKRMAFDLADPVTAAQFLCWGVGSIAAAASGLAPTALEMLRGETLLLHPGVAFVSTLLGFASTLCLYLSFFPPRAYQRRLRGAAPEGAGA